MLMLDRAGNALLIAGADRVLARESWRASLGVRSEAIVVVWLSLAVDLKWNQIVNMSCR